MDDMKRTRKYKRKHDNETDNSANLPQNQHYSKIPNNKRMKTDNFNDAREFRYSKKSSSLGFHRLKKITEMDSDSIIIVMSGEDTDLKKLIESDLSPDYIVLILQVVSQLCTSTFQENKGRILATLCQKFFMEKLQYYISKLLFQNEQDKQRNTFFWNDPEKFWNDLIIFYEHSFLLIPNTACEVLIQILGQTSMTVSNMQLEQNTSVSEDIKTKLDQLYVKVKEFVKDTENDTKNKRKLMNDQEPSNNFRTISLYPNVDEVTKRKLPFIRENIVDGSYKSVEHYLDIQFRLLREDFVAPLREGICEFIFQNKSNARKKIYNIRIYRNVQFVQRVIVQGRVSQIVQFSSVNQQRKKIGKSGQLMFGSLLCFTDNNFITVTFGTVLQNNAELLRKGQIAVDVFDDISYEKDYILVECNVYFEPYYQVMKALKLMDETNFSFKRYLIDVESDVNSPSYLQNETQFTYRDFDFNPLDLKSWPSAKQLKLDNSQYKAFQSALTKEFCLIQGPPGTGKTHIGLKVTEVLLKNMNVWKNEGQGPILVICFTNHALDQFLEGISTFTQKLIRIGGQSKSDKLKPYHIREIRKNQVRCKYSTEEKMRIQVADCMRKIKENQQILDSIDSCKEILDFTYFTHIDSNLKNSWFLKTARRNEIIEWIMKKPISHKHEQYEEMKRKRNVLAPKIIQADRNILGNEEIYIDNEMQKRRKLDDEDEITHETSNSDLRILCSEKSFEKEIGKLENKIHNLSRDETKRYKRFEKEEILKQTKDGLNHLKSRMNQYRTGNYPERPNYVDYKNPFKLGPYKRWGLYFHWVNELKPYIMDQLVTLEQQYKELYRQYEEIKSIYDANIMKQRDVIGMTTTGAAKFHSLLQALKCPIVIVEEAAEVLEAHIVASLTKDCKHLILIGDHKQLRPITASYNLAKRFNLEISLFERMVQNGVHCEQLEMQHRMRPEIVQLIVPAIYPKLENHPSVTLYPKVDGVDKNVFFITHTEPEEACSDSGTRQNVHEAKFLIWFARHLILQGYKSDEITILTTYSGQMFYLWKERRDHPILKDVRITVVDNFQGEENKIILLSLVRSNEEGNIGFLKTDNRICVALSRAKQGLYIIGNMDILQKSDNVWPQIKDILETNELLGTHLTLHCQIHPDQKMQVKTADDFLKIPEGGCALSCSKQLDCGHICTNMCHITDKQHKRYICKEKCTRLCDLNHQCLKQCYEYCDSCVVPIETVLKCGHSHTVPCGRKELYKCPSLVQVELKCGHKADKPCYKDIEKFPCSHICEYRKLCGHACDSKCHINDDPDHLQDKCLKPCAKFNQGCSTGKHKCRLQCYQPCLPCKKIISITLPCQHVAKAECSMKPDEIFCEFQIEKVIESCGHKMNLKCSEVPDASKCTKNCLKTLVCGHLCTKQCNEECTTQCEVSIEQSYTATCGHQFKCELPCFKTFSEPTSQTLLQYCTERCNAELQCGHLCSGSCGKCLQGRIHVMCQQKCDAPQICGHPCKFPCREMCLPCRRSCSYRCTHSKCGKTCGEPCTSCKEPCTRRCVHGACSELCYRLCNISPCYSPCPKLLKCKHQCLGFCGDPCPALCRICDPRNEIFTELLFGTEDEIDSRFVLLNDCGHILEASGMEEWLDQVHENGKEINLKRCPKCSTVITTTERYSEYIKTAYNEVAQVKLIQFGDEEKNEAKRTELKNKTNKIFAINDSLYSKSKHLQSLKSKLKSNLKKINDARRNPTNSILIDSCVAQLQIIERLIQIFTYGKFDSNEFLYQKCLDQFDHLLRYVDIRDFCATRQRIFDLELEINRFEKFVQFHIIENNINFDFIKFQPNIQSTREKILAQLHSIKKFDDKNEESLRILIEELRNLVDNSIEMKQVERLQIVKAIGLRKGHWYKCPNGHPYVIGECGGAMETAKCYSCEEQIGGQRHKLLSSNKFAGEFDGAVHSAFSNAANLDMRNYHFD